MWRNRLLICAANRSYMSIKYNNNNNNRLFIVLNMQKNNRKNTIRWRWRARQAVMVHYGLRSLSRNPRRRDFMQRAVHSLSEANKSLHLMRE